MSSASESAATSAADTNAGDTSATDPSAGAGTNESTDESAGAGSDSAAASSDSAAASGDSQGSSSGDGTTEPDCDPAGCEDYCEYARCLFPGDLDGAMCRAKCNEECGDVFFDEDDQSVMDCLAAVELPSVSCSDAEACCAEFFTNNICP